MQIHILTIFPQIFDSYFNASIIKRAIEKNIAKINTLNIRDYALDKHKTVDDRPYGGGAGMIMKAEPIYKALSSLKLNGKSRIILLSPHGPAFKQKTAHRLVKYNEIVFICGRYEGIDARVDKFIDEKISIGDYILTGGEAAAIVIVDSIVRLLPGTLGNIKSLKEESHSKEGELEYPQYTRPEIFIADNKELKVPKILLSGNHKKIEEWREKHKKKARIN